MTSGFKNSHAEMPVKASSREATSGEGLLSPRRYRSTCTRETPILSATNSSVTLGEVPAIHDLSVFIAPYVRPLYIPRQADCTVGDMAYSLVLGKNVHMKYKPRHFLREWRESAGLTLEQVAERVEVLGSARNAVVGSDLIYPDTMTHVTLSRIETGKQPYKQQLLEILAEIYGTSPASLIMRNPSKEDAIYSLIDSIPAEQRSAAIIMLRALASSKTGT